MTTRTVKLKRRRLVLLQAIGGVLWLGLMLVRGAGMPPAPAGSGGAMTTPGGQGIAVGHHPGPLPLPREDSQVHPPGPPGAFAGVNTALVEHFEDITNSSLRSTIHPAISTNEQPVYVTLLNLARQKRLQKDYVSATHHYVSILESAAPDEYHRTAMVEMALMNQEAGKYAKALQVFAQYLKTWPEDPAAPEIMLRQGLLYRQMGVPKLALAKFYSVMTSALTLKSGSLDYYQRLVLHAQAEIADTHYLEGNFTEAIEFLNRLLKQDSAELNRQQIQYKLIRCLSALQRQAETIAQCRLFLEQYPTATEDAEVRFLLAKALQESHQNDAALRQVLLLLKSPQTNATSRGANQPYWQLRAGNEIGNRLYLEGDYVAALQIYSTLSEMNRNATWQLPALYQVGLVYERLQQPAKAREIYGQILGHEKELASHVGASLKTVIDMARWRRNYLGWQTQAERASQTNYPALAVRPGPGVP